MYEPSGTMPQGRFVKIEEMAALEGRSHLQMQHAKRGLALSQCSHRIVLPPPSLRL
jgi:hypothetical protein